MVSPIEISIILTYKKKIFFLMFFLYSINIFSSQTDIFSPPHILILNSYHRGYNWTDEQSDSALRNIYEKIPNATVDVVYMDWKRYPFPNTIDDLQILLKNRYKVKKIDLILTTDDAALAFAVQNRQSILHNAPIVFMGIFPSSDEALTQNKPGITGVYESLDFEGTIQIAHKILPQSRSIYIIHDNSESSKAMELYIDNILNSMNSDLERIVFRGMIFSDLLKTLSKIPRNSIVIFASYARDPNNLILPPETFVKYISESSNAPVFVFHSHLMGTGALGGSLLDGKLQGEKAVDIAVQILNDKININNIPRYRNKTVLPIFDFKVMKHFGISENIIPVNSLLLNRPESFYYKYKYYIWIYSLILILLLSLSSTLIINKINRKRFEKELSSMAAIISATDDIVCTASFDGLIKYMNPSALMFYGFNNEASYLQLKLSDLFVIKSDNDFSQIMNKVISENIWKGEIQSIDKNNNETAVSAVFVRHSGKSKSEQYISAILRDMTAQKSAEENLKITLNSINDAVISIDQNGFIISVNPAAERITGINSIYSINKKLSSILKIFDSDTDDIIENPGETAIKNGGTVTFEEKSLFITKNDHKINISVSASPIINNNDKIVGAVIVCRDITRETILQEKLRQSQRLEIIGQLAGGVAHDFNNLLAAIIGSAELIQSIEKDNDETLSYVQDILTASLRASELTKHLLAFSRKAKIQMKPVKIHAIIDETIRLLSRSINKQIEIIKSFEADNDVIFGDGVLLQTAFLNISVNARDSIQGNGEIKIHTSNIILSPDFHGTLYKELKPGNYIKVEISDSGCGINKSLIDHIFEPYFTTKPVGKGTGLGLATVYGCVKSHKGSIEVASEIGKGTSFTILFPATLHSVQDEEIILNSLELNSKGKIIVIDDEELLLSIVKNMLTKTGYDVITFDKGSEAISFFANNNKDIDLIILDLIMPKTSGREVFYKLKEINPNIKVLLSSGFDRNSETDELLQNGANGFISKPYKMNTLSTEINRILNSN